VSETTRGIDFVNSEAPENVKVAGLISGEIPSINPGKSSGTINPPKRIGTCDQRDLSSGIDTSNAEDYTAFCDVYLSVSRT